MFYAVNLARAQLPDYFTFILIAFVTIYVTFYTLMTVSLQLDTFPALICDKYRGNYHKSIKSFAVWR